MPPDALKPEPVPFVVCRDGEPVPDSLAGSVAAIGNFDGVHRGHRALIERVVETGRPATIVTFEPHPRAYFRPDDPVFRLTPEPVKLALFAELGLDGAFVLAFNAALASRDAASFVDLLAYNLKLSQVLIGHDFHFGRGREGNPARMAELCLERGIICTVIPAVTDHAEPVSSSTIRAALEAGRVGDANRLLGYRWFVRAEVLHGDKRGRTLGYPTANMRLPADCRLLHGIYAVRARLEGRMIDGVASFGRRPTFDNGAPLLEVHLFDFAGDLYGRTLDVEFLGFVRGEAKFDSAEALVLRMNRDAEEAREFLASDRTLSMLGP